VEEESGRGEEIRDSGRRLIRVGERKMRESRERKQRRRIKSEEGVRGKYNLGGRRGEDGEKAGYGVAERKENTTKIKKRGRKGK
jgi:hypothetical protein